jgi:hypothetical protein
VVEGQDVLLPGQGHQVIEYVRQSRTDLLYVCGTHGRDMYVYYSMMPGCLQAPR